MRIVKARGSVSGFESQVYRKNGDVIWISENARAVFDDDGSVLYYEGTVEDITERKLYQARIEHQANYDTLTGLANRSLLQRPLAAGDLSRPRATARGSRWCSSTSTVSSSSTTASATTSATSCCKAMAERLRSLRARGRHRGAPRRRRVRAAHQRPGRARTRSATIMERMLRRSRSRGRIGARRVQRQLQHRRRAVSRTTAATRDTLLKHADSAMYRAKEQRPQQLPVLHARAERAR